MALVSVAGRRHGQEPVGGIRLVAARKDMEARANRGSEALAVMHGKKNAKVLNI